MHMVFKWAKYVNEESKMNWHRCMHLGCVCRTPLSRWWTMFRGRWGKSQWCAVWRSCPKKDTELGQVALVHTKFLQTVVEFHATSKAVKAPWYGSCRAIMNNAGSTISREWNVNGSCINMNVELDDSDVRWIRWTNVFKYEKDVIRHQRDNNW